MQPNIGSTNSFIRTVIGFSLLSIAIDRMIRKPWNQPYALLAFLGAMKVAEGLLHFCPIVALWDRKDRWMDDALRWENEIEVEVGE